MKVLVTGANGFVGQALCEFLAHQKNAVVAQIRQANTLSIDELTTHNIQRLEADFTDISSLQQTLLSVQAVVHTAARVHQLRETASDPLAAYRQINTQGTLALARAAADAGVKRFIFLSSVKVCGEFTQPRQPYTAIQAAPQDPYGISKWEAELGLRDIAAKTGMEVVIIRPPLVYGPGVKANFLTMMRWLRIGIPLPLGAIHNQRSLVALPNLVDFIAVCITHPKAANQTFMISDQHDVSTTELLQGLGQALKHPARLISVPQAFLEGGLKLLGKGGMVQRLCGDLTIDASPATELLDWKPPMSVQQGLQLTADHFLNYINPGAPK